MRLLKRLLWAVIALVAALALGRIATARGESINAVWLVAAAACLYALGFHFYSRWIAYRVLELDGERATPAERLEDGRDFVPTTSGCSLDTTSPPSPDPDRWSAPSSPPSSAICPAPSGSSSAAFWAAACRIS